MGKDAARKSRAMQTTARALNPRTAHMGGGRGGWDHAGGNLGGVEVVRNSCGVQMSKREKVLIHILAAIVAFSVVGGVAWYLAPVEKPAPGVRCEGLVP